MGYLSLTDADRAEMLAAIGVSSVDELFEQVPTGVRFDRELDVPPALGEAELARHLEELAAKNVHTGSELSFLGAGIYDLTGMDVSNASGYDGCTVAADACFVARHVSDRRKVVLAEALNPQVRQVVKTYARGFGFELGAAASDAAAVFFQHPNFLGCLENAPSLAAAANDAGALSVAHVDLMSLGVLEAPGEYGCAIALGEGQSAGNWPSYGGPHYGFLAARGDYVRRMPGRIVGETVDADGRRAFVLTLQTREQHIRREKATSNITTNQTLLALAGLATLSWLGPEGLREVGETCLALSH